ncbi:hypothetical protein LZ554_002383 [Drepanopeziza brunnea f. sp. 'monogermtubi']|nr:hypothetical protein LZ554_002383 [Drepanopeziza brunnea f. sp. 'monogermtubi']
MQTPGELQEQLSQLLVFSLQSHSEPPIHLLASTSTQSPFLLRPHSPTFKPFATECANTPRTTISIPPV